MAEVEVLITCREEEHGLDAVNIPTSAELPRRTQGHRGRSWQVPVGPAPSGSALQSTHSGSAGEVLALGLPDGISQAALCPGYCHHMAVPNGEGQRAAT